jgi:peptidoglycan/LPS O-acetylase OafA/YrhL
MNPLWDVLATQPKLVADHALAYAQLAGQEAVEYSGLLQRRLLLAISALCCATLSLGLAGVAVMLWFVSPLVHAALPWPLLIVPLVPALGLVWCLVQLSSTHSRQSFERLRQQWAADETLFKEASLR